MYPNSTAPFAVIVPLGPGRDEERRLIDLFDSAICHAPAPAWFVIVNDTVVRHGFERHLTSRETKTIELDNPRRGSGIGYLGGLCVGILHGLEWVYVHTDCHYAIKLDTDALIVGDLHYLESIAHNPAIGLAGVIGLTSNHRAELPGWELAVFSPVVRTLLAAYRKTPSELTTAQKAAISELTPDIMAARANGYKYLHYCQGGAYLITRTMMNKMAFLSCFERGHNWRDIPIGEDVIMGMYAYGVGLRMVDCSGPGQPFCSSWRGLPFDPVEVFARGHSLVHSVKGNEIFVEKDVRAFFRRARRSPEKDSATPARSCGANGFRLYTNESGARAMGSNDPKIVLLGANRLDRELSRIGAFHSLASAYASYAPDAVVVSAIDAAQLATIRSLPFDEAEVTTPMLIFSRAALPSETLSALQIKHLENVRGVRRLHVSGDSRDQGIPLEESLRFVELLQSTLSPPQYILSNQQVGNEDIVVIRDHVFRSKPNVVGCRDPETMRVLRRSEINASWIGHDASQWFVELAQPPYLLDTSAGDVTGFDCALPPHLIAEASVTRLSRMQEAFRSLRAMFSAANARNDDRPPVLINAGLDQYGYPDAWSVLRRSGFFTVFPRFSSIDLVGLALRGRMRETQSLIREAGVKRLITTSSSTALLFISYGVPSYIMTFNAYGKREALSVAQGSSSVDVFLRSSVDELVAGFEARASLLRRVRSKWQDTLRASISFR